MKNQSQTQRKLCYQSLDRRMSLTISQFGWWHHLRGETQPNQKFLRKDEVGQNWSTNKLPRRIKRQLIRAEKRKEKSCRKWSLKNHSKLWWFSETVISFARHRKKTNQQIKQSKSHKQEILEFQDEEVEKAPYRSGADLHQEYASPKDERVDFY